MMQAGDSDMMTRRDVLPTVIGLVRQLDASAAELCDVDEESELRVHPRFSFSPGTVACKYAHPNGETSMGSVFPRNLSASGVSVLKYGYAHEGTGVILSFARRDGESRSVEGAVAWCRMVRGNLHEVGIRFGKNISPHQFCSREAMSKPFSKERTMMQDKAKGSKFISGNAICVGDDAEEVGYIATVLAQSGLLTEKALSPGQGLDRVRTSRYGLVVVDLDMNEFDAEGVLMQLRDAIGTTLLVGLTWSGPEEADALAQKYDAVIVQKPVPSALVDDIERLRGSQSAA